MTSRGEMSPAMTQSLDAMNNEGYFLIFWIIIKIFSFKINDRIKQFLTLFPFS